MVLNVHRNHQTAVLLGARFYRPKKKNSYSSRYRRAVLSNDSFSKGPRRNGTVGVHELGNHDASVTTHRGNEQNASATIAG